MPSWREDREYRRRFLSSKGRYAVLLSAQGDAYTLSARVEVTCRDLYVLSNRVHSARLVTRMPSSRDDPRARLGTQLFASRSRRVRPQISQTCPTGAILGAQGPAGRPPVALDGPRVR
ncbi:hypothetical protein Acsp05_03520 [Actinokineospora sp. NBRC 105648]|nr:hypothetical protein Acsp05_03520 [Actinokineospora sp. NBRC 105648]